MRHQTRQGCESAQMADFQTVVTQSHILISKVLHFLFCSCCFFSVLRSLAHLLHLLLSHEAILEVYSFIHMLTDLLAAISFILSNEIIFWRQ